MPQPPAALRWIAARLLPAAQRELLLADLDEDYGRRPRVVVASLDFPTMVYQWLARERSGVEVVVVESPASEAAMNAMFAELDGVLSLLEDIGAYDQKLRISA